MEITVHELKEKFERKKDFVLIDVREPYEHEEFNVGGNLIPMGNFPMVIPTLISHKEDEIIVYCRSGRRSASVQYQLIEAGFTKVLNLKGGMLEWMDNFEMEKKGKNKKGE